MSWQKPGTLHLLKTWPRLSPPFTGQDSCIPGSGFPFRERAIKEKPAISKVSVLMNPGSSKLRETDLDVSRGEHQLIFDLHKNVGTNNHPTGTAMIKVKHINFL